MSEEAQKQEEAKPQSQQNMMEFPQDKIQGDGFSQLDPKTGWLWIGINLNKFSFRDAWAYIKSQEFQVAQFMSFREQQAMIRSQLNNAPPKARSGWLDAAKKLGIKV